MRIALSLLSIVALGEETATVVLQQPPPAPPAVLNCAPEVTRCVTKYETEIKEVEARALAKLQAELTSLNTRHATELTALKTQIADSNRNLLESQALVSSLQSKGSSELSAVKAALDAARGDAEKASKAEAAARVRLDAELGAAREALAKAEQTAKLAEERRSSLESELTVRGRQLGALEQKVTTFERVVFSQAHLEVMAANLKTIVFALARNLRTNVNSVFSVDVFELARLQGLLMYKRVQPYTARVYNRAQGLLESVEFSHRLQELEARALPWVERLAIWTEAKMERVIAALSKADPAIREMFPESFGDRLCAFLYLFTVFYVVKTLVTDVSSTLFAPFQYVFSRSSKHQSSTASVKKPAKTSTKSTRTSVAAETVGTLKHRKA